MVPQTGLAVTKKRSLDALLVTFVTDGKGDESRLCCLVEAALRGGAQTLYTEDLTHGERFESLTVLNPFTSGSV